MFSNCFFLSLLYLTNFDTSQVINLSNMFSNCISLVSLDLSSLFISSAEDSSYMFYNCKNLEFINILSFHSTNRGNYSNMFYGTSDYLIYCIRNNVKDTDLIKSQLISKNCSVLDCSSDWQSKKKFFYIIINAIQNVQMVLVHLMKMNIYVYGKYF